MQNYMPEGISAFLKKRLDEHNVETIKYKYGTVSKTGDGVARISNLSNCKYGELLRFENTADRRSEDDEKGVYYGSGKYSEHIRTPRRILCDIILYTSEMMRSNERSAVFRSRIL